MSGHHVIKKNRKDFSKVSLFRITRRGTRMGRNGHFFFFIDIVLSRYSEK